MGLKGSLRDFGIAEILQLISGQRRTGRLSVEAEGSQYEVLINSGRIVRVEKKPEGKNERLFDYLLLSNLVSENQLRLAIQKARSELKPLESVLVGLEIISALDLKRYIFLRNLDLLYQLFLLKDGEYEFEAEPVNYHPFYAVEIDSEQVLMDGYRVKDEWGPTIRELVSIDSLFSKSPGEFGLSEKLSGEQAKVYDLVNGRRGIAEIAVLAEMTRFDTIKTLAELKRLGRIEAKSPGGATESRKVGMAKVVSQAGFWIVIVAGLLLFGNGIRIYAERFSRSSVEPAYEQSWREERVRQGLEIYWLENGSYPEEVSELMRKGILGTSDLKFGKKYKYYKEEGGYQFQSLGL